MSVFARYDSFIANMFWVDDCHRDYLIPEGLAQITILGPTIKSIENNGWCAPGDEFSSLGCGALSEYCWTFLGAHIFSYGSFVKYDIEATLTNLVVNHASKVDIWQAIRFLKMADGRAFAGSGHADNCDNSGLFHTYSVALCFDCDE